MSEGEGLRPRTTKNQVKDAAPVAPVVTANAVLPPPTAATSTAPSNSQAIVMGLNLSVLECLFVLMEFIFGSSIMIAIARMLGSPIATRIYPEWMCEFVYSTQGQALTVLWVLARFSWNIQDTFTGLLYHIQVTYLSFISPIQTSVAARGKALSIGFVITQIVSFTVMVCLQLLLSLPIYSMDNLLERPILEAATDTTPAVLGGQFISWLKFIRLVILNPVSEELIFRCVMLSLVHIRFAKHVPATKLIQASVTQQAVVPKKVFIKKPKAGTDQSVETPATSTSTAVDTPSVNPTGTSALQLGDTPLFSARNFHGASPSTGGRNDQEIDSTALLTQSPAMNAMRDHHQPSTPVQHHSSRIPQSATLSTYGSTML